MRRIILSLIVISFAGAGFYASSTVNAAELFNSSKKSSSSSDSSSQLFNGGKGLKKVERSADKVVASGLKKSSRTSLSAYQGMDLFSMIDMRMGQMNNIAKIVYANGSSVPQKRGWGPQGYSMEEQKKIYTRNSYVVQNLGVLHLKEMAQLDQVFQEDQALKAQNWEEEKRARRLAKYGKRVGKALGGYDFPKVLEVKDSAYSNGGKDSRSQVRNALQNSANNSQSDSSSGGSHVVRETKTISTPRLFNNVE